MRTSGDLCCACHWRWKTGRSRDRSERRSITTSAGPPARHWGPGATISTSWPSQVMQRLRDRFAAWGRSIRVLFVERKWADDESKAGDRSGVPGRCYWRLCDIARNELQRAIRWIRVSDRDLSGGFASERLRTLGASLLRVDGALTGPLRHRSRGGWRAFAEPDLSPICSTRSPASRPGRGALAMPP
jgi:hypothetical protein